MNPIVTPSTPTPEAVSPSCWFLANPSKSQWDAVNEIEDFQEAQMEAWFKEPPVGKVRLVTAYRGSRKSFTARKVCNKWRPTAVYKYIDAAPLSISDLKSEVAQVGAVATRLTGILVLLCLLLLVLIIVFTTPLGVTFVLDSLHKYGAVMSFVTAVIISVAAGVAWIRFTLHYVIVVDDILKIRASGGGAIPTEPEVQGTLLTLRTMAANGYCVFLLSSNEGLSDCFADKVTSEKQKDKFPTPDENLLLRSIWDQLYKKRDSACRYPTIEAICRAKEYLPAHIALSMHLWLWVAESAAHEEMIEALLNKNKLNAKQLSLLADFVVSVDLQSSKLFRAIALEQSPTYPANDNNNNNNNNNSIVVTESIPRRLVLTAALICYYVAVEELMLLELLIDALNQGTNYLVEEVLRELPLQQGAEPTLSHVLSLIRKVKTQLEEKKCEETRVERIQRIIDNWKRYNDKTHEELKDFIINRKCFASWPALPKPSIDTACPSKLDAIYNELPEAGTALIWKYESVPLYRLVRRILSRMFYNAHVTPN